MDYPESKRSRFASIDLMKGVAVMAMIQVHLTELFASPAWQKSFGGQLSLFVGGPFAAPLFMVVMGYLAGLGQRRPARLLLRGAKLILWGLLLNLGMNAHLFFRIYYEQWSINPLPYIFGADILFLAGLAHIPLAVASVSPRYSVLLASLFLLAAIVAGFLEPYRLNDESVFSYLMAFVYSDAKWSYFPLVPWVAYPLSGFIFSRLWERKLLLVLSEKHYWLILFSGLFLLGYFFDIGWNASRDLIRWYHHEYQVVIWNLIFVITAAAGAHLLSGSFAGQPAVRFLYWTGRNVTAFYVFQWLIIGNVATFVYQTQYPLLLLFWYVGVTAICSGLVWLKHYLTAQYTINKAGVKT